jgi:hypothetical protein
MDLPHSISLKTSTEINEERFVRLKEMIVCICCSFIDFMILFGSKFIIHILSILMGNQQPQQKPQPKVSLEDALIDMKIQSKQVIRAAKNSEK